MSGFIVLKDGRAYAARNWAYDCTIECIAEALAKRHEGQALSTWLLDQRCVVQGPGLGSVDIRELTPENQKLLLEAMEEALELAKMMNPKEWHEPSAFPSWLAGFEDLGRMIHSVKNGEPPSAYNPHMRDVLGPTGNKKGPGWEKQA